ncbi:MAG: hypothetical protein MI742_10155 [Desulfobacterales bacterium]|nr:hypothetical protein [Desulfobacterales bacterium]
MLFLFTLLIFAVLGVAGWIGYTKWAGSSYPGAPMAYIDLDETTLQFTSKKLPHVYTRLRLINQKIELIQWEIDRIAKVERSYPRQKRIVQKERKRWSRALARLQKQLARYAIQTEALFVTHRVNTQKGVAAIREKGPALAEAMDQTLASIEKATTSIRKNSPPGPQGLIETVGVKLAALFN